MMNITVEMIEDWLCEQEDDLVIDIYNEFGYGNEVCGMRQFDDVMGEHGYDRFDSVQMALGADRFDTEDDYFKIDWPYVESSNEAVDLIDYEQLAQKIHERGTENEIYKEWVKSLEKPEHTEDEYIKALTEQLDTERDNTLATYKNFFWDDGTTLHPMSAFVDIVMEESLADVIRRLVMTLTVTSRFFGYDFFIMSEVAFDGFTRSHIIEMIAHKLYESRETFSERDRMLLGEELVKIMKGEF